MVCMNCGANAEKGFTTDVTDVGDCLIIVEMYHAINVRSVMKYYIQRTSLRI